MVAPAYHRHLSLTSIHRSAWKGVLRSSDVGLRTEHGTKNEDEHAYAARNEAHHEAQQEHYHEVQRWISTSDSSLAYILRLCRARCYFWLLSTQPLGKVDSRNFAITEYSGVRIAPVQQLWATRPRTGAICCLLASDFSSRVRATPFSSHPPPERPS